MLYLSGMVRSNKQVWFGVKNLRVLKQLVGKYGETEWKIISQVIGTKNPRQCHDRWFYYLTPNINKAPFTEDEDSLLLELLQTYGPRWVQISKYFAGRTDTQIKNRYHVLKRKIQNDQPLYSDDQKEDKKEEQVVIKPQEEKKCDVGMEKIFAIFDNVLKINELDFFVDPFTLFEWIFYYGLLILSLSLFINLCSIVFLYFYHENL